MPESARWLIANGKVEQAQMYLSKCAKINKTNYSVGKLDKEVRTHTLDLLDLLDLLWHQ